MSLAFIPLYIKYLGIECYGLIGLFATLTAWLSLLDMGMTPTLSREMARITGGAHTEESIRDLLRTTEIIAICVAAFCAYGVQLGSKWIAEIWLKAEHLPIEIAAQSISIMGLIISIRFLEGIYRSSIIGLQRQVLLNSINIIMSTLKGLGAVGILAWVSPTIQAFFLWQGIIALATVIIFAIVTYACLPKSSKRPHFSTIALTRVWRYASGMMGITFMTLLLTQIDKVLLSRMISLSTFGYYSLAASVASALYIITTPLVHAWFPNFTQLHELGDNEKLIKNYHLGSQMVSVLVGSTAMVLIIFSKDILYLWTQDSNIADQSGLLLSLLTMGNFFNCLLYMPDQMQYSHGWISLRLRANILAVVVLVPAILWGVPRYGATAAAWIWIILNFMFILIYIQFMHLRILKKEKISWYFRDTLIPLCGGGFAIIVVTFFMNAESHFKFIWIAMAWVSSMLTALYCSPELRKYIRHFFS
jgi:O-antigen/teichoic acid export membrane protein